MAGFPVVVVPSGGLLVTEVANGVEVSVASNGFGVPITIVASGGVPVTGSGGGGGGGGGTAGQPMGFTLMFLKAS